MNRPIYEGCLGLGEGELLSPQEIVELLPGVEIGKAEIRRLEDAFAADDPRAHSGSSANVALVRARKP